MNPAKVVTCMSLGQGGSRCIGPGEMGGQESPNVQINTLLTRRIYPAPVGRI